MRKHAALLLLVHVEVHVLSVTHFVCKRMITLSKRARWLLETWTGTIAPVEFARVQEASRWWSVWLNILEARADSRFYRVLLKLSGMQAASGSQGYSVLLA